MSEPEEESKSKDSVGKSSSEDGKESHSIPEKIAEAQPKLPRPALRAPYSLGSLPAHPRVSSRTLNRAGDDAPESNLRPVGSKSLSQENLTISPRTGQDQSTLKPSSLALVKRASIRSLKQFTAKRPSVRTSATTLTNSNHDDSASSGGALQNHRSFQSFSQESLAHDRIDRLNDAEVSIGGFMPIDLSKYDAGTEDETPYLSALADPDPSVDLGDSFRAVDGSTSFDNEDDEQSSSFVVATDQRGKGRKRTRTSYKTKKPSPGQCIRGGWNRTWDTVQRARDGCGALVNNERVQVMMILLILVNALMMGIATFGFVRNDPKVSDAFQVTDDVFLSIFTIELGMQLAYHGIHLFLDAWLLFDFCIIILSWALVGFQIIRAFRIFRALRLITRLGVLRNLLTALFAVAPSLGGIVALLILVMYVYGVMCTVLFKTLFQQGFLDEDYFGTLMASIFTLFQMITLDEWASIARQVLAAYSWSWVIFSSYLMLTAFILYSLIIAVVCDAVKVTEHQDEKDEKLREEGELHERVMHLEHHIADMAEQQFMVVENLHIAMQALHQLEDDDSDFSETSIADEVETSLAEDDLDFDASGRSPKKTRAALLMPNMRASSTSRLVEPSFDRPNIGRRYASLSDLPPAPSSLLMEMEQPLGTVKEHALLDDVRFESLQELDDDDEEETGDDEDDAHENPLGGSCAEASSIAESET